MKYLKLTQGKFALVDDEDYEKLSSYHWYFGTTGYGFNNIRDKATGKQIHTALHRKILGLKRGDGKIVDHINRNRLDNRKQNLRIVTQSENTLNGSKRKNNTSGLIGINLAKRKSKTTVWLSWRAYITVNNKQIHLGYFKNKNDAQKARTDFFKRHHFLSPL